jgi:BirA family biotin operon repressor/biotin-[acetyl-CoA-carboxylase] ligase
LDGPDRHLWRLFAPGPKAWTADVSVGRQSGFWRRLIVIDNAPRSQFDVLHEALADGVRLDGPTAVMAMGGRGFRGQRGRPWSVETGNLFLTLGLPVGRPAPETALGLTMLPALAVVDALSAHAPPTCLPAIKWVNDILINGRKVGGVLTSTLCRAGILEEAILGIGVNVARAPLVEPTPFVRAAGCLRDEGIHGTLDDFVWRILRAAAERYGMLLEYGQNALLDDYRAASCVVGRRVRIWHESVDRPGSEALSPAPLATGVVTSIEADLSLRLDGRGAPIARGRLAFEEDCQALGL